MTPESVRREILLLASSSWAGPWQVLLRVGELDRALLASEIATIVEAALDGLAQDGCLRFTRGDPTLGEGNTTAPLPPSRAMAEIRHSEWRAATPEGDIWFTLTRKGERALDRELDRRIPSRRKRELAKVVAGFAAAVRGMTHRKTDRRGNGSAERLHLRPDRQLPWGYDFPAIGPNEPLDPRLDIDFDDDAGLSASPVPRRPPDRSGSGAAFAVPEFEFEFEVEAQRIA